MDGIEIGKGESLCDGVSCCISQSIFDGLADDITAIFETRNLLRLFQICCAVSRREMESWCLASPVVKRNSVGLSSSECRSNTCDVELSQMSTDVATQHRCKGSLP